jgi:crossover junction endodeoxyribonuclease RuvC
MKQRILAVDPSLRGTGYAVVQAQPGRTKAQCLEYGVLRLETKLPVASCLLAIFENLSEVILRQKPEVFVIESTIFVQSYATAILLGSARGAALLAAAKFGLEIHEFAPRKVKQAVVGRGAASKAQVAFMVRTLFGLDENPPADAADALAVAHTYLHTLPFQRALAARGSSRATPPRP